MLDLEVLLVRVGLEKGINAQAQWMPEKEVTTNPVGGELDLS